MKIKVIPLINITSHMYQHLHTIGYNYTFLDNQQLKTSYTSIPWVANLFKSNNWKKTLIPLCGNCDKLLIQCNRSTISIYSKIIPILAENFNADIHVFYGDSILWFGTDLFPYMNNIAKYTKKILVSDTLAESRGTLNKRNIQYVRPPGLTKYFFPKPDTEYLYDVTFVGQSYMKSSAKFNPDRLNWLKQVVPQLEGARVGLAGDPLWSNIKNAIAITNHVNDKSHQKFIDCNNIFNQSRITLAYDVIGTPRCTSIRTANALLSGTMVLIKYQPEFDQLFQNHQNIVWFNTNAECVDLIKYYLKHEDERLKIAEAGRQLALKDGFTDQAMVEKLIED